MELVWLGDQTEVIFLDLGRNGVPLPEHWLRRLYSKNGMRVSMLLLESLLWEQVLPGDLSYLLALPPPPLPLPLPPAPAACSLPPCLPSVFSPPSVPSSASTCAPFSDRPPSLPEANLQLGEAQLKTRPQGLQVHSPLFLAQLSIFGWRIELLCEHTFSTGLDLTCSSFWGFNFQCFFFWDPLLRHVQP